MYLNLKTLYWLKKMLTIIRAFSELYSFCWWRVLPHYWVLLTNRDGFCFSVEFAEENRLGVSLGSA